MIEQLIDPVNLEQVFDVTKPLNAHQLGTQISINTDGDLELDGVTLAIVGVSEDRASVDNHGCGKGLDAIRKELYQLYFQESIAGVKDFGTVKCGETIRDTQVALTTILNEFIDNRIAVLIIGAGHDLTYGQFQAYQNRIHKVDIAVIDEKIDADESKEINSGSFLWHILNQENSHLFSCTHFGHQLFYNNPKHVDFLQSLNFDTFRLGEMKKNLFEMEPYLRNADMVSFDVSAIKSADMPANAVTSPNGLSGEDACQLARFAGFSNKVSTFGIYEFNPYFDQNKQGAKQISQMMWYFIEGFSKRKVDDFPSENNQDFVKYIVKMESTDYELIFWKSNHSNKWWMEIPQKDLQHSKFLPCSYSDYKNAMQDELPDRWMKVYAQLN